jgi:hypothetical protein
VAVGVGGRTGRGGTRQLAVATLACALACLAVAGPARAAATITYPVDGETVTPNSHGLVEFRWTLPPGELEPEVYMGDTPSYSREEGEFFKPYQNYCGVGFEEVATSCIPPASVEEQPIPAGTHYALVATGSPAGLQQSPLVRFLVPFRLGWGCSPLFPACHLPQVQNFFFPRGDGGYPAAYNLLVLNGWSNGSSVTATFTLRRGSKLVKRIHVTKPPEQNYMVMTGFNMYRLPGIPAGTRLACTVEMSSGGVTIRRSMTLRAGGGPKAGLSLNG